MRKKHVIHFISIAPMTSTTPTLFIEMEFFPIQENWICLNFSLRKNAKINFIVRIFIFDIYSKVQGGFFDHL